jgi:hypothetical protein
MAALVVVCTTALTLLTVRWLAPQLLGAPIDLQLVQSSKTVPPFFEGVFRDGDYATDKLLLNDPRDQCPFQAIAHGRQWDRPARDPRFS